ncbi:MAG: polyprenol monophosphomannose synthase [Actinomycetota bacterium]|nr:polyprenol monophosphomannose synthase [Actinomycetota bacterium]
MSRSVVVTPTFEEVGNIGRLIDAVIGLPGEPVDVLVVDDSSPDGTGEVVAAAASAHPGRVRLLSRLPRSGLGTAYVDGFAAALDAGYERVIEMDADGSHDPLVIPAMLAELEGGADVVIGSRYVPGGSAEGLGSAWRKVLSRAAGFYARRVTGIEVADITGGFRAFRSSLLSEVEWDALDVSGFGFQVVSLRAYVDLGARITEVPIHFRPRSSGESKMSAGIMAEGLRVTWSCRASRVARPVLESPLAPAEVAG